MRTKQLVQATIDAAIFAAAVVCTHLAQSFDRPITAVLLFLTGVILIAVRSGLPHAIAAAVTASVVYNFFLSEPAFEFGIMTADQALPLIAFNLAALLSGFLVGRLKSSANRAHQAQVETAFLLTLSDRLQSALRVEDVEHIVRSILPKRGVLAVELFVERKGDYVRPITGESVTEDLRRLIDGVAPDHVQQKTELIELKGARGSVGFVKFHLATDPADRVNLPNLESVTALLAVATERCILLEEVAEAKIAARSEALKDAILSSVSHDLRTPLTVIETAAGALTSDQVTLPELERTNLLVSILEQCRQLDRYTSELLDVGRIQAGLPQTRKEVVDLAEIVQLSARRATMAKPAYPIEREVPRIPVLVNANAVMLEQAILNVLDNALKFGGKEGSVTVCLRTTSAAPVNSIEGLGPGLADKDRSRAFERFGKVDTTGDRGGTGLGLFVAKGFLDTFGGSIEFAPSSERCRGTCVIIRLPLADTATAAGAAVE